MNSQNTYRISAQSKEAAYTLYIRYNVSDRRSISRIVEDYEEDKNPMIAGGAGMTRPCVCALAWAALGRPEREDIQLGPECLISGSDTPDHLEWTAYPEDWSCALINKND